MDRLILTILGAIFLNSPFLNAQPSGLFDQDDFLEITLSGNLNELLGDRGDDPQYHPMTLTYKTEGVDVSLPITMKVRGHFRKLKSNCTYPPLLLNFSGARQTASLFSSQDKIKLVTPCQGEKYVVREYLVYKLYNLITPKSFKVRLVKVVYRDAVKGKQSSPLFGLLLEEEEQMAGRNGVISVEGRLIRPEQTQKNDFLKMAVFEYLIGNTDWSVQYMQNVKLIAADSLSTPSPVAYDFDHAGIVGAPYAHPAEQLFLSSTRERRYRGYCLNDIGQLDSVFDEFRKLEKDIYAVYANCPYIEESYRKSTIKYLEDFYKTINNPKLKNNEFGYPCRKDGTGNVVIMGLDKN